MRNNNSRLVRKLMRRNKAMRRGIKVIGFLFCTLLALTVLCLLYVGYLSVEIANKKAELADIESVKESLFEDLDTLQIEYDTDTEHLKSQLQKVSEISIQLDKQNKELVDKINEQNETLNRYESRKELFDQYEYAIIRSNNTRTDIKYSDIDTLESLAKQKNMGPDAVDLVLAFAMNESEGYAHVKNPRSTATGLCGLLRGTAKFVYENEMGHGRGTYNHSMAYDGTLNLQMSLYYIDYLARRNGRSSIRTINSYRGTSGDTWYLNKLNRRLSKTGKSIYTIKI